MELDNALNRALPGGSITKPILIALGALLVGKMFGGGGKSAPEPELLPPGRSSAPATPVNDGSVLDGLGGMLDKLRKGGLQDTVDSWVGTGPNQPVPPGKLGPALGDTTISELARKAGVSEQELLEQLSKVLPQVVNTWTPQGRLPSPGEFKSIFGR
ncbi:MAG: YidB family protein [Beijerinckiaceae bacterium]